MVVTVTVSEAVPPSASTVTGKSVKGESVPPSAVRGALDVRASVRTVLAFVVKTLVSRDTVVHATSTPNS